MARSEDCCEAGSRSLVDFYISLNGRCRWFDRAGRVKLFRRTEEVREPERDKTGKSRDDYLLRIERNREELRKKDYFGQSKPNIVLLRRFSVNMKNAKFPKEVTVASFELPYIFEFPSDKNFNIKPGGSEGRLLELLSEALNFKYKLITPPDYKWGGRLSNGTWSRLVGMVSKGEADMAICSLSVTNERQEVVDFSKPYFSDERTFATNFPRPLPRIYTYIYPFDMKTWYGIIIVLLLISLLFKLLKLAKFNYIFIFLSALGNLCSRSIDEREFERNILLAFWWAFSFIISSSYAAVLASLLALPVYDNSPRNLDELAEFLKQKQYKVVSVKESSFFSDMLKIRKENVAYIAKKIQENNWFISLDKLVDEDTFDSNTAVLATKSYFNFRFGKAPLATKFISNDAIEVADLRVMLNKRFCCKAGLDVVITKIVEGGLYQRIADFEIYKAWFRASNSNPKREENVSFVLDDVLGPFIILSFGYFMSAIVFLAETMTYHLCERDIRF
ncbi:Glutamate receptor 2 like protein [Argiope bruennichi]|uniref:Glutamate receptor 2 like protein n=1 Tax=Argiope bruennichi TaxID=94029 RepID=A0A8T0F0V0_ARGBR|nr:Glutamate receptor 2 like protein [Argiope bruennichi]